MNDWVKHFDGAKKTIYDQCCGKSKRKLIDLTIQNLPKGKKVLEVGCGTALLSLVLADYGYEVTALDVSEDVLNYAREKVWLNSSKIGFVQGDILNLTSLFDQEQFDLVCHSGVMEHFTDDDIIKGLREQKSIAKKVIFNIPNNRVKLSTDHFGDERLLSNCKWVELIKKAGFNCVEVYGGYDLPNYTYFVLPGFFFHRKVSFWWKWFSRHSVFVCY